jgi:hypothetical protein
MAIDYSANNRPLKELSFMKLSQALVSPLLASIAFVACGGNVQPEPATSTEDTGVPPTDSGLVIEDTTPVVEDTAPIGDGRDSAVPTDHGAPSDKYPAFAVDMPELITNGGVSLTAPVIVTVTYPGDLNADSYETFGDKLGETSYWKSIVSEYGVGPTTSGAANHVRETTTLPASMTDSDLATYIADHVENHAKYGWPTPTDQSIYTLYIPSTTSVSLQGNEACTSGIGGYHSSVSAAGLDVAYAIVLQCKYGSKATTPRTVTASHELAEASTDPHPQTGDPGYYGVDDDHIAWDLFMQGNVENGDLCEIYRESRYSDTVDPGFAYNMQRCWSNASAKAGHNPCVPAPTTAPYYNVTALETEKVTMNATSLGGSSRLASKGFKIALSDTRVFQVGIWSEAKTGSLTIRGSEGNPFGAATTKRLSISLDRTSGVNGEKVNVTVRVNSVGTTKASVVTIVTSDGTSEHYMPILISSQ